MTTPNLASIIARLTPQKDVTLEMQSAEDTVWRDWPGWSRASFAASLLDLVQRQDERIAGLEGVIRAQEAMTQSALEPVGVNGPPWDHHAAEDAADLILALRAERDALKAKLEERIQIMDHVWRCEVCGDIADPISVDWKWVGDRWEHSHGEPIGRCAAQNFGSWHTLLLASIARERRLLEAPEASMTRNEEDYKEEERDRIIGILMGHRSEFRVCWYSFDGYHVMLSEQELRAKLSPRMMDKP